MKVYTHPKYSYVRVAEIPKAEIEKIDFALCKQPRETLGAFYNRQTRKPDLLTNGGFFSMSDGVTCFNFRDENTQVMYNDSYQWGMGIVGNNEIGFGHMNEKPWRDFISGYPNLIEHGKKLEITFAKELNYKARRTMLGYSDTTVYLVCVENPGLAYKEMQDLMLNFGCTYAINLDGGGSTKMLHNGKSVTKNATNRAVDNVVAVYLKKDTSKKSVDITYQVYSDGKWSENIINYNNINKDGYAGTERKSIQGVKAYISDGSIKYRAHTVKGRWLPWVTDDKDYAGIIGRNIDAIQIKLIGDISKEYEVKYRVRTSNGYNYLPWVSGSTDYAGIYGKPIDKIQISIEEK